MKITSWNRSEGPTMLGATSIQTEFKIITKDSIGDSLRFLAYIEEYDPDMSVVQLHAAKDIFKQTKKDHEFWKSKNLDRDDIIAQLDAIFLDENGEPRDPGHVSPEYPITWDRITLLIEMLLREHGVFYKPEKREMSEEVSNE